MGKSFNKNRNQYQEKDERKSNFKRRKNQIKEEREHDDFSDYKIHGFKREKIPM